MRHLAVVVPDQHGMVFLDAWRTLRVADVAAEPLRLAAPVHLIGFPDIRASAGKAEGLEAHRLEGTIAGEDHQVGPRDLPAVLLLDRPEQPARLVDRKSTRLNSRHFGSSYA